MKKELCRNKDCSFFGVKKALGILRVDCSGHTASDSVKMSGEASTDITVGNEEEPGPSTSG